MKKNIIIRTEFIAYHRYKNAPDEVSFLKDYHRHKFFVECFFEITTDREKEYFLEKHKLDGFIQSYYQDRYFQKSCEQIAEEIMNFFPYSNKVRVFEDNENGSEIMK